MKRFLCYFLYLFLPMGLRAEIIRGLVPAIYGADAFGGGRTVSVAARNLFNTRWPDIGFTL
jgi:hypothetical protein